MKKPQVWYCEQCGTIGNVMYEEGTDVWTIGNQIHVQHMQYKPKCGYRERVIVMENLATDHIICAGR